MKIEKLKMKIKCIVSFGGKTIALMPEIFTLEIVIIKIL